MKLLTFISTCLIIFSANAKIRVTTYNIRNFDYDERSHVPTNKEKLVDTLKEISPDFMAVQEINDTKKFKEMIENNFSDKYETVFTECGGAHGQRLGFVFNTSKFKLLNFEQDMRTSNPKNPRQTMCDSGSRPLAVGKFLYLEKNETFVAISAHLKSGGNSSSIDKRFMQIRLINEVVLEQKSNGIKNFIVMGDFNSTEYIFNGKMREKFEKTVSQMQLKDMSEKLSCTAYWWGGKDDDTQYPSLLDHVLITPDFMGATNLKTEAYGHCRELKCSATHESQMGVSFDEVSDHCPIVTDIE